MIAIDTHAHLQYPAFEDDIENVLQRATEAGVEKIIVVGTTLADSAKAIRMAESFAMVYASIGVHPSNHAELNTENFIKLKDWAAHPKVVAIGECGLDYINLDVDNPIRNVQKEILRRQLGIAVSINKPVILHNREADEDFIIELSRYSDTQLKGVQHCFTGSRFFLNEVISLGLMVSFTGIVTKIDEDSELAKAVFEAPSDKYMVETDSPYITPKPLKGSLRNESANVVHIINKIATIKKVSAITVGDETTRNAKKLFKFT